MTALSESEVVRIWQRQLLKKTELITETGESVAIIYPGRANDDRGADFRDAVIARGDKLVKGDIEVHVRTSDWQAHRHHRDTAYNRVILHVVMWHNDGQVTRLQNGGSIPVLALHRYLEMPADRESNLPDSPDTFRTPCLRSDGQLSADSITEILDRAGDERFLIKAAGFQTDLAQMGAGQSLYQKIMGALGYSKNKLPFMELAGRVPLRTLDSVAHSGVSDEECLARQQALLLGTAGLLSCQQQDRWRVGTLGEQWIERLVELWGYCCDTEAMPPDAWHLFKVRPNNSPVRRLVAMSYLLLRYRKRGIFNGLVDMIMDVPLDRGYQELERGLLVTTDCCWTGNAALLGCRRAADIIVNVLLPFTFAWGQFSSRPELGEKALAFYQCYPRLGVNSIERHMKGQLGLYGRLVDSARRQQGLIHIYQTLCTQGGCSSCPLGQSQVRDHVYV